MRNSILNGSTNQSAITSTQLIFIEVNNYFKKVSIYYFALGRMLSGN